MTAAAFTTILARTRRALRRSIAAIEFTSKLATRQDVKSDRSWYAVARSGSEKAAR